jgi:cytochrome c-type biogenesis protein CcmH/NrfG
MANTPAPHTTPGQILRSNDVYIAALLCLALGLALGYFAPALRPSAPAAAASPASRAASARPANTLQAMKNQADQQIAPLIAKLQNSPNDAALLTQVAAIYHRNHQFAQAAGYFQKAVDADPKNVALRTQLASSLYRAGDIDTALDQLSQALHIDPKDANALFNLGIIRLQAKGDGKGAVKAWQLLLKSNPQLSPDRKAEVQTLMAGVMNSLADQKASKGASAP